MNIITRYKDDLGNIIRYDIEVSDGNIFPFDYKTALGMSSYITNAILVKGGDYRAKKGCHIETCTESKNLDVVKSNYKTELSNTITIDYYGKEYLSLCRKIRKCASSGKVKIDTKEHSTNNGKNLHLFDFIRACGFNLEEFISGYLSVLQPYCIERYVKRGYDLDTKKEAWIVDLGYHVKLLIKLRGLNPNDETLVVSFHESNYKNKVFVNKKDYSDKLCAVFINKCEEERMNSYPVYFYVQKGFLRHEIRVLTQYINKDVALVEYKVINDKFETDLKDILNRLLEIYANETTNLSNRNIKAQEWSFGVFGFGVLNNLSYLIELYNKYTSENERLVLVDTAMNLLEEVPPERLEEYKLALENKYSIGKFNNKLYKALVKK